MADNERWMSYAELAADRGISKASAGRLVRRRKWRRQTDNQGNVRILVPMADGEDSDSPMDIVRGLRSLFTEQLDHERARADRAEANADKFRTEAEEARTRLAVAEAEAGKLREAETARRNRALLVRLRAAWRGE
jgi:hypothetical protein